MTEQNNKPCCEQFKLATKSSCDCFTEGIIKNQTNPLRYVGDIEVAIMFCPWCGSRLNLKELEDGMKQLCIPPDTTELINEMMDNRGDEFNAIKCILKEMTMDIMKASKGRCNPSLVNNDILKRFNTDIS